MTVATNNVPDPNAKPIDGLPVYEKRAVREAVATGDEAFNPITRGEMVERFVLGNLGITWDEFKVMGKILADQLGIFSDMPLTQILSTIYYLGCYDGARLTMAQLTIDTGTTKEKVN